MKTLNLMKTVVILSLLAILSSCSKDDDEVKNKTAIKFKSINPTTKSADLKTVLTDGLALESFKINISEIEFEFDDDDPLFNDDNAVSDFELKGPFEVELMEDGNPLEVILVNNVELPAAAYDEIEFEFDKNKNQNSEMYGKTAIIKGSIDGTPFVFWSDNEVEMEIEFDELFNLEDAGNALLTVSFDLRALLNPAFGGVDITAATDGNQDGIIEIYTGDPDGNSNLANLIWKRMKYIIKAFEDQYDD
ncbi:MAG: hypothetical protein PHX54_12065 [Lentimicrobiaceae bacterium]|nr:hypothetical protein [Lentimicrobiaceae bacterium]